jgi:hypothetical protein
VKLFGTEALLVCGTVISPVFLKMLGTDGLARAGLFTTGGWNCGFTCSDNWGINNGWHKVLSGLNITTESVIAALEALDILAHYSPVLK